MSTLEKIKALLADRDNKHSEMKRDDAGNVLAPHTEDDWDDVTAACEREVYKLIDGLVREIENPTGKWTIVCDWYGDGDAIVIHAVGDTASDGRRDASLKAFNDHKMLLNVRDHEVHPKVGECDGEGYVVAMFPGHRKEVRF